MKYKYTNHAINRFKSRFYDVYRAFPSIKATMTNILDNAEVSRIKGKKRLYQFDNGCFRALCKKRGDQFIVITVVREFD